MNCNDLPHLRVSPASVWDGRAISAHQRFCERNGYVFQQPTKPSTFKHKLTGEHFVVLHNGDVLGVYRVGATDRLHRVRAWPDRLSALL